VGTCLLLTTLTLSSRVAAQGQASSRWWSPGDGHMLPAALDYANPDGTLGILNTAGPIETKGHPFFEPIGTNGRACVTCHQPSDAMTVSAATARERWRETGGRDPLFAAIDGKNCPNLPQDDPAAHSLLLERGLIRVFLPWPPQKADGTRIDPEFTIEVVRDPTRCNTDPQYGLTSSTPTISVYRRPRMAANLKYVTAAAFGVSPFIVKNGQPAARDPETGALVSMNMMADAREPTLRTQAVSAAATHLQVASQLQASQIDRIVAFESQVYAAQRIHRGAGSLVEPGGPPALGPAALASGSTGTLGKTPHASSFRWATDGRRCRGPATRRRMRETRCANRWHVGTTCSSSARSGSATPCTSTRSASAIPPSAPARHVTACI
ncbi:MAG: hypothetical protein ABW318_07885, partial [Vicinamibacterales bacterium]